jgi:hypothetical protein
MFVPRFVVDVSFKIIDIGSKYVIVAIFLTEVKLEHLNELLFILSDINLEGLFVAKCLIL